MDSVHKDRQRAVLEGYISICRLPHSRTHAFIVVAVGLAVYGGEEAGKILSEASLLTTVLKKLPSDWADRNLELIFMKKLATTHQRCPNWLRNTRGDPAPAMTLYGALTPTSSKWASRSAGS
jgi:hypothetical protein